MGAYTDMTGKTVLVTGASSGIGARTALELARMGARVLVHARDDANARRAADEILASVPKADLIPIAADLSSMSAVRGLAERVTRQTDRLDVLINNAGVYMPDRIETEDGIETTFAVNHVAAFALTALLDDTLARSAPSRIVTVSSVAHFRGVIDFDDPGHKRHYDPYVAYASSKLANVLFSAEAAARFAGSGVTSNSLHPGVIDTKLLRAGFPGQSGADVAVGAATPVYVASSPELADVSGRYFVNQHPAQASSLADDQELRIRLWEITERLSGVAAR
jgi:NAD(P)-dependent dehydrogenase (short-subunit alcohol dehydrogenase family)